MIIRRDHRLIFVHIPKTAGTSITDAVNNLPMKGGNIMDGLMLRLRRRIARPVRKEWLSKHSKAIQIRKAVGSYVWWKYFKFAVVRNPWDTMVSSYVASKNAKYVTEPKFREYHNEIRNMNFDAYIKSRWGRGFIAEHKTNMLDYIADENGKIIIDYTCKFENLEMDLKEVCKRAGIQGIELAHKNKSKNRKNYRTYYSKETREIIAKRFAEVIDRFKYTF